MMYTYTQLDVLYCFCNNSVVLFSLPEHIGKIPCKVSKANHVLKPVNHWLEQVISHHEYPTKPNGNMTLPSFCTILKIILQTTGETLLLHPAVIINVTCCSYSDKNIVKTVGVSSWYQSVGPVEAYPYFTSCVDISGFYHMIVTIFTSWVTY